MSYIITATVPEHTVNRAGAVKRLLASEPLIRLLSEHDGQVVLDMRGDFDTNAVQVRWLCVKLIDAGILEFDIGHSF